MNKSKLVILVGGIFLGMLSGIVGFYLVFPQLNHTNISKLQASNSSNEPLYWVAPMDPNFRRDKPGKSPMGMDLVPVFENGASNHSPGTVKIEPVLMNNLGVKTVIVRAMVPSETITTFGKTAFAEDAIVHIHPRVEGWVETLSVRNEGEYIVQGKPLYSLYSPELVNAQEELLIALAQGNDALINAAKSRLIALKAPVTLIDSIQKNRKVQRTIMFYAPQSGYVSALNVQEGFYVTPATTMLAIANMDRVWVIASIFASDASKVEVGQSALITSDYFPQTQINAEIDYVYPTLDMQTRTLSARFVVDNNALMLKPGMFTQVVINTQTPRLDHEQHQKIIVVPHQAIIRTGNSSRAVLALGKGKFKSVKVKLGRVYDDVVEITGGLEEGDKIVSSAQFLLDSESSISSDFKRMTPQKDMAMSNNFNDKQLSVETSSKTAWASATVNEVLLEERMVNLTHGPLEAFDMVGMTMNFLVAEDIDITQFKVLQDVHVEIVKTDSGMYRIKTVHFMNMPMDENVDNSKDNLNGSPRTSL